MKQNSGQMLRAEELLSRFDPQTGTIEGCETISRRLSDLHGLFVNQNAFETALRVGDPVIYTVSSIQSAHGEGQLHCGLGVIMPGRIGNEYYFTRGHVHSWRNAAEFYVGLNGEGKMILENEASHESVVLDLLLNSIVYVPGKTAHRTVNVGDTLLVYLGIYPAEAGHDYTGLAEHNFKQVIVAKNNKPAVVSRKDFLAVHK